MYLAAISPQKSISHILLNYKIQSSDEIGKGIAPPASSRVAPAAAAATPSLPHNDEDSDDSPQQQKTDKESDATEDGHGSVTRIHTEKYLQAYHHQTKAENPLYRTSQSVIGARPPSLATVVTERHAIPQAFSTSFGNILYSDQVRFCGAGKLIRDSSKSSPFRAAHIIARTKNRHPPHRRHLILPSRRDFFAIQSLNTTLSRSKVHRALDPHFY